MASFHFSVRSVARGRGSSAVARAAYISRERLRDELRHRSFDFRARGGLEHSEILLPAGAPTGAGWARDRSQLWNAAEQFERRRNSRVAREYVVALPHELSGPARLALAREFAQQIGDRFHVPADLAVHQPPPGGDPRNHHAHVLTTTRELLETGLGRKTDMELNEETRRSLGLISGPAQFRAMRASWAEQVNVHLFEAGLDLRVDSRSHWERGLARIPAPQLTKQMLYLERSGQRCEAAERLRELHAAGQQQMLALAAESALATPGTEERIGRAHENGAESGIHAREAAAEKSERELTPRERELRAIERWRAYRRGLGHAHELAPDRAMHHAQDHGAEFDL